MPVAVVLLVFCMVRVINGAVLLATVALGATVMLSDKSMGVPRVLVRVIGRLLLLFASFSSNTSLLASAT